MRKILLLLLMCKWLLFKHFRHLRKLFWIKDNRRQRVENKLS